MDFDRSRRVWHAHIARWGGGVDNGFLVRGNVKRPVTMGLSEYSPRERALYVDGAVRFMISALKTESGALVNMTPDDYPDFELDYIEFADKQYKILMVPQGAQPDGTWIAFDTPAVLVGEAPEVS